VSPLILIDASSYFFRAFHALPPLTNSKGQATGAIFGVANMIKKLIKTYQPERLAVVFDASGKTFRDEWYPAYKAHRSAMPDELRSQFHPLLELIEAMGLPLLIVEGVEADDVIGTLAHHAKSQHLNVLISTGDKDLAQLVTEQVTLINTMTNHLMTPATVREKFGVNADQMIDYLTLTGDASDNIPGVNQCGPKTAAKWLNLYHTLDNLLAHAHEVSGKIGESLRACIPHLTLSKRLVTIKTDVELPLSIDELVLKSPKLEKLRALTQELEFKTWHQELLKTETTSTIPVSSKDLILDQDAFNRFLEKLKQSPLFCFTIHCTTKDLMSTELLGISFVFGSTATAYLPFVTNDETVLLSPKQVFSALKPILEDVRIKKLSHNMKWCVALLKNHDVQLQGGIYDLALESYVLNSAQNHDLATLATSYLEKPGIKASEPLEKLPLNEALEAVAAEGTLTFYPLLVDKQFSVFQEIEMPLVEVLADMERLGVLIDKDRLFQHGERLKARISELEKEAFLLASQPFNLNSPKQLLDILYGKLQLPVLSKTPKGQPSTAEPVLQELALLYPLPAIILEYRGLAKLVSTYIDALPKRINPQTRRVHTSYNQTVTATGRLSSSDPNLQNIPARSEEGRLIRTAFIAPQGSLILSADYSQIELRIMAHLSQDEALIKAFQMGWDIHSATAAEIFHTPLEMVSAEQRRRSKAVNFGLIYGMSAFGLAKQIGVDRKEAQDYIDRYFQRYPKVFEFMERTRLEAREKGYVETLFGRRLYLPGIQSRQIMQQKAAERAAINAPMQGTAADLIKKAMLAIANWINSTPEPHAHMIMQVHDELVFEVEEQYLEECKQNIQQLMEQTATLSVPLLVSVGVGANWGEAHSS
jgi:DNA polymerase-1